MLSNLLAEMGAGISAGREAHVSIEGQTFNAVYSGETRSITLWDQARSVAYMEFIVIGTSVGVYKAIFEGAYDPKRRSAPICFSVNGVGPSVHADKPQSATCQQCPWDVWGSAVSVDGKQIKRCTDKKRLVVISPILGADTPLQFDIPPASLAAWMALLRVLRDGRVQAVENVIIRVEFVPGKMGVLSFTPSAYVDQAYGEQYLQNTRATAAKEIVRELAGRNDTPINPASWSPALAAGAVAPALPSPEPVQMHQAPQPITPPAQMYQAPQPITPPAQMYQVPQQLTPPAQMYQAPQQITPPAQMYQAPQQITPPAQMYQAPQPITPPTQMYQAPQQLISSFAQPPVPAAAESVPVSESPEAKQKRYRRTKAEMEAARAAEGNDAALAKMEAARAAEGNGASLAKHGMVPPTPATSELAASIAKALNMDIPS
jgi:hypothetical protein